MRRAGMVAALSLVVAVAWSGTPGASAGSTSGVVAAPTGGSFDSIASLEGRVHRLDPDISPRPRGASGEGGVSLVPVGGGYDNPVNAAFAPGETDKVYVVEQDGTARVAVNGTVQPQPFLDITPQTQGTGEQGFLGMAFHPDFATNGLVYAYYTDEENGDIVVDEFETNSALDADETSRRQVIRIRHRFASNHNGGHVTFGPDDYMYLATGDGGSGDDPKEKAQDKGSLLGKLIRIDPLKSGGDPYTVPDGNPFVGKPGRDAIYALGLRNPFRFNFEPETGNIMIGDVGQDRFEEVNIESPQSIRKANFGWDRWEGFKRSQAGDTASKPSREDHDKPVLAYDHSEGASVIGGLVVHDPDLTNLVGRYLFTDYFADRLRSFEPSLGRVDGYTTLDTPVDNISAFAEDPVTREVHIVSQGDNALYRLEPLP
jgi:glucose/arabinose dehydrogenase